MRTVTIIEKGDVFRDNEKKERFIVLTEDYTEGKKNDEKFAAFNMDKEYRSFRCCGRILESGIWPIAALIRGSILLYRTMVRG